MHKDNLESVQVEEEAWTLHMVPREARTLPKQSPCFFLKKSSLKTDLMKSTVMNYHQENRESSPA